MSLSLKSLLLPACAACMVCLAHMAVAASPNIEPDPDAIPVLKNFKQSVAQSAYDYIGTYGGMQMWMLTAPSRLQVIYVPEKGDGSVAAFGGVLMDAEGVAQSDVLQSDFVKRYPKRAAEIVQMVRGKSAQAPQAPQASQISDASQAADAHTSDTSQNVSAAENVWQRFVKTSVIVLQGKEDAPEIVAVLDPDQESAKQVWNALSPLAKDKKITLRIMPLATSSPDGILQISAVLAADDPVKIWDDVMHDRLDVVPAEFPPETAQRLKDTIQLASDLSLRDLPFFMYRSKVDGKPAIQVMRGVPENWADLTGIKP